MNTDNSNAGFAPFAPPPPMAACNRTPPPMAAWNPTQLPQLQLAPQPEDDENLWFERLLGLEPYDDAHDPKVAALVFPIADDKGHPEHCAENFLALLSHYHCTLRFNELFGRMELGVPGIRGVDAAVATVRMWAKQHGLHKSDVDDYLQHFIGLPALQYDPVKDWIESVGWDGVDRIQAFLDTIETTEGCDPELKATFVIRWLVSCIAARYEPYGISAQGVLVFTGPQGCGKTRLGLSLAPDGSRFIKEAEALNPENKDDVRRALGAWITELGELDATFRKADIARLKAFITTRLDVYRVPYGKDNEEHPRRTIFWGSVNDPTFLNDATGSRRWWVIPVTRCRWDHDIDVQQLWAQVLTMYRAGERWHLTTEEQLLLEESNQQFTPEDPLESQLLAACTFPEAGQPGEYLKPSQVLRKMRGLDEKADVSRSDSTKLGKLLAKHAKATGNHGGTTYLVSFPPPIAALLPSIAG